jgi:16S rRNA (uracil1498-N3)-methyltransferase
LTRLYLPITHVVHNRISIAAEKAHYLVSVLRCKKGDDLIIFNGQGKCFRTAVVKAEKKEVIAEVREEFPCNFEPPIQITLVQSLLKGEKMDLVIQKTTELGVTEILPVMSERSQIKDTRKIVRWRRIAEEASRQSGRNIVPAVHEPVHFQDFLFSENRKGIIFYEEEGLKLSEAVSSLAPQTPSLIIMIGPEGGFSKEEVISAQGKGFRVASLGKRILRAETAAISAVALIQFLLGDMG